MGSKTNARRLKRVYRCEVCVKTFRSLQALNFHKKTHYKNASKDLGNKKQTGIVPAKKADQVFAKPEAKIAPVSSTDDYGKKLLGNASRKIEFSCPKCDKSFNVYFSAFRHVQKYHCIDSKGNPVNPNSPNLIKPIRREQCSSCNQSIKATEFHTCAIAPSQENLGRPAETYVCIGCAQMFSSVKTFDVHVSGVHNVHVQSLFFPNNVDFIDWKQRVEKQAKCTYALMSRYSSKDIYRCTYSPINDDSGNLHFCPSSFIHQKFTKGVQVHFYPDHFGHPSTTYIPTARDKQFCIKYLLEKAEGYQDIADMKSDSADAYIEFKNLMEHIVLEAAKLDIKSLKRLMGKALQMSSTLKEYDEDAEVIEDVPGYTFDNKPNHQTVDIKSDKQITDEQIDNELQETSVRTSNRIRRKSTSISASDFFHEPLTKKPKTNPLSENINTPKKLNQVNFVNDKPEILDQHEPLAQLRIVDTFSLNASCVPQSSTVLLLNDNKKENLNIVGHDANEVVAQTPPSQIEPTNETITDTNKVKDPPKVRFSVSQSQSFNDSYKEFVDKNFKALDKPIKPRKQVMKTKIGQFIPNSPRRKSTSSPTMTTPPVAPRTYTNTKKITKAILKNDPKIETKPVSESESKSNSKIKSKSIIKSDTESSSSNDTKLVHKNDTKLIPNNDTKLIHKNDTKPMHKNDTKAMHKNDTKAMQKNDTKSMHKNDMKPSLKNDTKPSLKNETELIPKTDTKPNRKGHKKHLHKSEENPSSKIEKKLLHKNEEKPVHKSEKKPIDKNEEKSMHKSELKSIPKNNRKTLDSVAKKPRKTKLLLNKSLEIKYEIKEQENDCNILVLKI